MTQMIKKTTGLSIIALLGMIFVLGVDSSIMLFAQDQVMTADMQFEAYNKSNRHPLINS
jgi:hypothetical protein